MTDPRAGWGGGGWGRRVRKVNPALCCAYVQEEAGQEKRCLFLCSSQHKKKFSSPNKTTTNPQVAKATHREKKASGLMYLTSHCSAVVTEVAGPWPESRTLERSRGRA